MVAEGLAGLVRDAKIRTRLSCWKGRLLSIGGRVVFIKSVLGILSIFFMAFYKALVSVLEEIESVRNKFL